MKIEVATSNHVNAIAALWHQGWHQGHGDIVSAALVASRVLPEFQARTAQRINATKVGLIAGQLAGFYMLDEDELYQFYIDAGFQGTGAAAALMAAAERDLTGRLAWLACSAGNARAAGFYRKAGWVQRGEETYQAETSTGSQDVRIWRFEKDLRGQTDST